VKKTIRCMIIAACFLWLIQGRGWARNDLIEIYYADAQGMLVTELRLKDDTQDLLKQIGQELLQGPMSVDATTEIPQGTTIHDLWLEQGILHINFSRELFSYGGGTYRERILIAQIVYTFMQHPSVESVQILVEGVKSLAPEGSPTDRPIQRSEVLFTGGIQDDTETSEKI
jgi:spore germination protein GerM